VLKIGRRSQVGQAMVSAATDPDLQPPGRRRCRPSIRTPTRWPTPGCCCPLPAPRVEAIVLLME
jgi:hypothetical protein